MKKLNVVFAVVVIVVTIFLAGCGKETIETNVADAQKEVIKIGFIGPLTGDIAKVGIPISKGVQFAAEQLQQKGENIEVVYEDGKCSGKDALNAYTKLRSIDNVQAVITVCSPELLAVSPIAQQDNVLVISPSATAPSITAAGKHVFRLTPSDALQGKIAADLINKKNYGKIGVLYVNHDYGVGLNNVLKQELREKIVASEAFEQESNDFRTQLTKLKSKNIDVLYIVAFPKDAALILKQMKELNVDVPVIAAEAAKDVEILPYADEKILITVPSSEGRMYQDFAVLYAAKFNEEPKIYSGEAYDTMNVIGLAAKANNKDLVAGMQTVTTYNGVAGTITFDADGDISKPYDLFTVNDHQFVKLS